MFLFFLTGLVLGVIVIRKNSGTLSERLLSLFQNYYLVKSGQSAAINFSNTIFRHVLVLLTTFCIGLCAVGIPFLYMIPFVYGSASGIVSALLYKTYMLKGIGYCALILYPAAIPSIVALIYAGAQAAKMSSGLMKTLLDSPPGNDPFHTYCRSFLLAASVDLAAAVIETAMFSVFSGYFQFS